MNLFDRFTRVAKANINNVLKNLEDPEKIMNQAVEDMQVSSIVCEKQNDREWERERELFLAPTVNLKVKSDNPNWNSIASPFWWF